MPGEIEYVGIEINNCECVCVCVCVCVDIACRLYLLLLCTNLPRYLIDFLFFTLHLCLTKTAGLSLAKYALQAFNQESLDDLMNGPIRKKLGIIPKNVTWGGERIDLILHFTDLAY